MPVRFTGEISDELVARILGVLPLEHLHQAGLVCLSWRGAALLNTADFVVNIGAAHRAQLVPNAQAKRIATLALPNSDFKVVGGARRAKGRLASLFSKICQPSSSMRAAYTSGSKTMSVISSCKGRRSVVLGGKVQYVAWLEPPFSSTPISIAMQRTLVSADLSRIQTLEAVDGAALRALERLRLPASIKWLDLSYCSSLHRLEMGSEGSEGRAFLEYLNLDGCRALREAFDPHKRLAECVELNLGYCVKLSPAWLTSAIQACSGDKLRSLVLRGVASDQLLSALQGTESLTLADLSFSHGVHDKALEAVSKACKKLQRCNLRACPNVSRTLYNSIHLLVSSRARGGPPPPGSAFFYLK